MSLDGKVALVTGATMGIGLAITELFLERGALVIALARDADRGDALVARVGSERLAFYTGDIGEPGTADAVVAFAQDTFGPLDVLVNNAAVDHYEPLLEVTEDTSLAVLRTNFHGSLWLLQAAARAMTGRGGAIVNLSSRLASIGVSGMSVYGASKGAVNALTRGAAVELAKERIRVNAVAPGFTETPLLTDWLKEQEPGERERQAATIPLGRLAKPSDVAFAVAFLASDEAGYITGATLPVDGGYTAQ